MRCCPKIWIFRKIRRFSPEFWVYLEKTAVYAQSSGSVAKAFGYTEREKAAICPNPGGQAAARAGC